MRFVSAVVIGFCALVAICAGVARATGGGGGTIASGPVVPSGIQQNGNTSSFTDVCGNGYEFWTLQLKQGDLVKITWGDPTAVDTLALWPAGTLDQDRPTCLYASGWSNWAISPVLTDSNGTPATTRVSQTVATADGSYPLLFLDTTGANAGPYSFTAVVQHAAEVSLPDVSTIPAAGKVTATVVAPDTSPISDPALKLTLNGIWSTSPSGPGIAHKLATATPTDGAATFTYSLPPSLWGKKIQLRVTGSGASYYSAESPPSPVTVSIPTAIGPVVESAAQLKAASRALKERIYWAGPLKGYRLEFTRTQPSGYAYVRYLPHGARVGSRGTRFLIVATYPFPGAYNAVEKYSKGKAVAGPNGSIYYVRPGDPKSVIVAFRGVNYQVEVYDPHPAVARTIAATGRVRPVR